MTLPELPTNPDADNSPKPRGPYRKPTGRKAEHGVRGEERRRAVGKPDRRRKSSREIEAIEDFIVADQPGGWEHLTNRELVMVQTTAFATWAIMRMKQWTLDRGEVVDGRGEMPSVLAKNFIAYGNLVRRNLELLGLRPDRTDKVPSLEEYLTSRNTAASPPTSPDAPSPSTEAAAPASEPTGASE